MFAYQVVRDHGLLLSGRIVEMDLPAPRRAAYPRGTYCGNAQGGGGEPSLSLPPCDIVAAVVMQFPGLRL